MFIYIFPSTHQLATQRNQTTHLITNLSQMTTSSTGNDRLFTTRQAGGRLLYKLYMLTFTVGILSVLYYRVSQLLSLSSWNQKVACVLVSVAEFWFGVTWLFQQGFRWAPTYHSAHPQRVSDHQLPSIDLLLCTADPDREPPALVANTLLSLMAYDYGVGVGDKLAYYVSDDGASELTFHAIYQASIFANSWLPFCRTYHVEPRAPQLYFSHSPHAKQNEDYQNVKVKYEEMQEAIASTTRLGRVPEETRKAHKGFRDWRSSKYVNRGHHQSIVQVLLRGNGEDRDAQGNPMPSLVYVSREKQPNQPHHYKAGALNALNRVSGVMSNAPLILNVDCDMHSNNSQALRHAVCFFLDPLESHRIGYVQFPQSFGGVTKNDLYANGVKRIYEIEFFGTNAHNGPMYAGTGSVHRRECLNGRKFDPKVKIKLEDKSVKGRKNWEELEEKAKDLSSCTFENGKAWGKEMGLMYGCAVEDVYTGVVLHSRGWNSVYCSPERKAYLGLAPVNTNDTLIQHKRWSTGLLEIFLSDYCPWTYGIQRLKLGQIMCYSFYTLWALWSLPMLTYGLVLPLAMFNELPLFPTASNPWFKVFASLGVASHLFSLGELVLAKGTFKMWWNETRMWMMKGASSYMFSVMVIIFKLLGISEAGFEITSKVIDEEALKRYEQEKMEFAVPSPMFIPPMTLSLLNLYCFVKTISTTLMKKELAGLDQLALQIIISGYITVISLPLYEAMFLRTDKGRVPTRVTVYSIGVVIALLYVSSCFM